MSFIGEFNDELVKSGEFVEANKPKLPSTAKTVGLVGGQVVVSDGPFAEAKESLAGYRVFDLTGEARAVEPASKVVVWAERVELRRVGDEPSAV